MNSGLQCLSNTTELARYFIFKYHLGEINRDNPLGMGGRLAKAYSSLMHDMYRGTQGSTAPWDLKKTLGSKVNRFAGYDQQDSAEFVGFIVELLHEDLNRVKKKPYIENSDEPNRPDEVVAKEYWDNFTARNQSIIVDIMNGQFKSTVTCLTCSFVSTAFDPYTSI